MLCVFFITISFFAKAQVVPKYPTKYINHLIQNRQYIQAQSINLKSEYSTRHEANQKTFNTIYIAKLANPLYAISNTDKDVLNSIAAQCVYLGGNSVVQARNFLMAIEDRLIEFKDSCGTDSTFILAKSANHTNDDCQNYVQNGTFTEYENCPEYIGNYDAQGFNDFGTKWKSFNKTPDYYNFCSQNGAYIPYTGQGICWPIGDSAMMGIVTYASLVEPEVKTEILGNNLCGQLEADENYCTKLFISCSEYNKYPVSSFGVYFAEEDFYYDSMDVILTPQLQNESDNFLTDTGWVSLQWIYHADGNENVIGIGNFENQGNTIKTNSVYDFGVSGESYYNIENVSIEKLIAAQAGSDLVIAQGQSATIGLDPTEVAEYSWTSLQGDILSTSQYPIVSPDSTTTYIVTKNQCNVLTTDTVTVIVSPTSLANLPEINYFNLYPNPAQDAVNIYFLSKLDVTFQLLDVTGKVLYSQLFAEGKNGYQLPLTNFANGIYVCNLQTTGGQSKQLKLIIAR